MAAIADLLRKSRVIAVVGLSSKKFRPSYGVAEYMQKAGYRIIPVNPNETEVLGEKAYARLADVPAGSTLLFSEQLQWPVLVMRNVYVLPGIPEIFRSKFLAVKERWGKNSPTLYS